MALAIVMPCRNVNCVRNNPSSEASAIFQKSPRSTFSRGMNSDNTQKSTAAPNARKVNNTIGDTSALLAMSLQHTTFKPKIIYAPATARCPDNFSFAITAAKIMKKM